MTNHDMISTAMQSHKGKQLCTNEIKRIVINAYPNFCKNSCFPNFHADGNIDSCWCVRSNQPLFRKIRRGVYEIL